MSETLKLRKKELHVNGIPCTILVEDTAALADVIRGQLHLTGGFADGSGGAYVLCNVADMDEARAIVATDPLAIHDCSELTIHEWNTR